MLCKASSYLTTLLLKFNWAKKNSHSPSKNGTSANEPAVEIYAKIDIRSVGAFPIRWHRRTVSNHSSTSVQAILVQSISKLFATNHLSWSQPMRLQYWIDWLSWSQQTGFPLSVPAHDQVVGQPELETLSSTVRKRTRNISRQSSWIKPASDATAREYENACVTNIRIFVKFYSDWRKDSGIMANL